MKIISNIFNRVLFNLIPVNTRFKLMHRFNFWGSIESVSGPGSEITKTTSVRHIISEVIKDYKIASILDIPCSDFNWMKLVNLSIVNYIGADIVRQIIDKNNTEYTSKNREFRLLSIYDDNLPKVNMVFSRDCFIHFSNKLILKSLKNIKESGSKYLLTNHYPDLKENIDIKTGTNRPMNLQINPFNLPEPIEMFEEKEFINKIYGRKMLALWEIEKL